MEDLMVETIRINGVDCYYIPNINETARDLIYGEDPLKKFTAAYPLELYITNVDGYEGEREFFSKFGLEIKNNMSVIVSKRSFSRWVPQDRYVRPREGDLIYIPFFSQTGEMYEIKYVNYTEAFYVMGNKYPYFYKLELEKFKRITPATIKAIAVIRARETGSLKRTIPKIAVPAAPIPVQTA